MLLQSWRIVLEGLTTSAVVGILKSTVNRKRVVQGVGSAIAAINSSLSFSVRFIAGAWRSTLQCSLAAFIKCTPAFQRHLWPRVNRPADERTFYFFRNVWHGFEDTYSV